MGLFNGPYDDFDKMDRMREIDEFEYINKIGIYEEVDGDDYESSDCGSDYDD